MLAIRHPVGMTPETAAWILKNERDTLGRHPEAVSVLRSLGYVQVIHGQPVGGEWPILAIEAAPRPEAPRTYFRRSTPEASRGLFWCKRRFEALMHTLDRGGLVMHELVIDPADLIAEYVMQTKGGLRSGGEFIADLS